MAINNQQLSKELISNQLKEADHDVVIIMVPFPCQSHLNQLLHLSCLLISSSKIPVHYAGSSTHLRQAQVRFNKAKSPEFSLITFHEFPIPDFPSPPPNPNSFSKFPSHLIPSFESSIHLRQPISDIFRKLSLISRRVIVIHDMLMSYTVQDGATLPNVELYAFNPVSAFTSYYDGRQMSPDYSPDEMPEGFPSNEGCIAPELNDLIALQIGSLYLCTGVIYNSSRSIEGTYIDLLQKSEFHKNKRQWAIGPLNTGTTFEKRYLNAQHKCLEWLDKQPENSVLYVCFGTTISMKDEEIKELALGLEESGQKFIWVFRDADRGNILEGKDKKVELPMGFEERVKGSGMVVRDWAPQLEILEHPSTGGFMSHCGWNSCLESITMGVPMVAWPMHSDQPRNSFLITDILKVGVIVRKWEQHKELVTSTVIANAIKTLMASKEGEEMRKRAEKLGCPARQAVKEGGISRVELDSFISHITR